jgi:hypothetical protein
MMSDTTIRRFYYIFDSREERALVLDRTTGREVAWQAVPRVQLLEHVQAQCSAATLRRFARWCARQTGIEAVPQERPAARLWRAARDGAAEAWSDERAAATDAVVRAAALGLSRRRSAAAQLLAVHACTHPAPRRAAIDAAHMSERWAEFEASDAPDAAVRALRQRQIDWLLDRLLAADDA